MDLKRTEQGFYDIAFNISGEDCLQANRAVIALNSEYFANLIANNYEEKNDIINLPISEPLLFETLLHYLSTNFVIACR